MIRLIVSDSDGPIALFREAALQDPIFVVASRLVDLGFDVEIDWGC